MSGPNGFCGSAPPCITTGQRRRFRRRSQARPAGSSSLPGSARRRPGADRGRVVHARHARRPNPRAGTRAAPDCPPPGRLPGVDDPVRGRGADRPGHANRARGRHAHVLSRKAVRFAGIELACTAPIRPRGWGNSPAKAHSPLRWALMRPRSQPPGQPGRLPGLPRAETARGLTHTRASLTISRKIARRSYHLLHQLRPAARKPIGD